jgi:hypothetical protein
MTLVSTFELLFKPQLPKSIIDRAPIAAVPALKSITRNILQGYFLSIANLTDQLVNLTVVFTIKSLTNLKDSDLKSTLDSTGVNGPVSLKKFEEDDDIKKFYFEFPINKKDTGLFILQANVLDPAIFQALNFEERGYVEIFISDNSPSTKLLITAEHRGTFFGDTEAEAGEVAYALPLASGKSLFELSK